jgi:hypothetical protein
VITEFEAVWLLDDVAHPCCQLCLHFGRRLVRAGENLTALGVLPRRRP